MILLSSTQLIIIVPIGLICSHRSSKGHFVKNILNETNYIVQRNKYDAYGNQIKNKVNPIFTFHITIGIAGVKSKEQYRTYNVYRSNKCIKIRRIINSTSKYFCERISIYMAVMKRYWSGPTFKNTGYNPCTNQNKKTTFSPKGQTNNDARNHENVASNRSIPISPPSKWEQNNTNWINTHKKLETVVANNSAYLDPYEKVKGFDVLSRSCTVLKSSMLEVI